MADVTWHGVGPEMESHSKKICNPAALSLPATIRALELLRQPETCTHPRESWCIQPTGRFRLGPIRGQGVLHAWFVVVEGSGDAYARRTVVG